MSKVLYVLLCAAFFGAGAYVWKVKNTGLTPDEPPVQEVQHAVALPPTAVVVEVGSEKVTQEDVDWEYKLVTEGLADKDELTPIPNLGEKLDAELETLRKSIIADLIERKLLFTYLHQDKEFNVEDPGRYASCMSDLQQSLKDNPRLADTPDSKTRLRTRLCERSILDQYMKERLFKDVKISDAEILEYFKNHAGELKQPERVEIRQILLPDEDTAKRVRAQVNSQNFAQMAREKSIAPEAVDGGKLGPFSKVSIPSIFEMALQMRKGEISEILKSPYGYHIIMLLEKYPKEEQSLPQARAHIEATLRKKKEGEAYQKWVEQALASINVNTPKPLW